jgi:hypothetical protein
MADTQPLPPHQKPGDFLGELFLTTRARRCLDNIIPSDQRASIKDVANALIAARKRPGKYHGIGPDTEELIRSEFERVGFPLVFNFCPHCKKPLGNIKPSGPYYP